MSLPHLFPDCFVDSNPAIAALAASIIELAESDPNIQSNGGALYQCTFEDCKLILRSRFSLKRHLKLHVGEKNIKVACGEMCVCGMRYMWNV
jgi:hypothetical protein